MLKNGLIGTLALTLVLGAAACDDDNDGLGLDEEDFFAELNSANEVPDVVVPSNATGTATFDVTDGTVEYQIEVEDITGVVAAHIHSGDATVAGPIVVFLFDPAAPTGDVGGELVEDSFTAADILPIGGDPAISLDSLLVLMGNGNAYVNVHTTQNPAGEFAVRSRRISNRSSLAAGQATRVEPGRAGRA